MKRLSCLWILIFFIFHPISYWNWIDPFLTKEWKEQLELIMLWFDRQCKNVKEADYPTIFIPGIWASWYSSYGYDQSQVKRWIPDPLTRVYDTLFYTFKQYGYTLEDVFYDDEFNVRIEWNPKGAMYLFGYDWKKDRIYIQFKK